MHLTYIKNTIEILNSILESDTFPLMSGYYTVIKKHDLRSVIGLLSDLQAENEKLQKMYQEEKAVCHATQVELERVHESLDFARTKDAEILRLGMELGHLKKHMERLTHRLGNGEITYNMARDDCRKMGGDCQIDSKILDRLAAYEETGLEPEEIDSILDAYGRGMTLRTENAQRLEIVKDIKTTRLRELALADREKRCVVMPCQPGYKVSYKSSTGFWCNAVIKDYTPENIFITAETEIPNAEPLSHTFSIFEIESALRREKE